MVGAQSSSQVPEEVCQAIEQCVAQINVAGAIRDKSTRQQQYSNALSTLTPVLKRYGKENLSTQAAEFAQYTELVAGTDPTDAKFGELVEKRLKSRALLQNICMPYTTTR
jgi:hypothetical protein